MKKYIVLALSAALFGMTSCTEDQMDKVNVNNENPPASLVSANLQITDAIMSTAFTTVSGDYAFYTSSLTEQEFGTGNNQLMNVELRKSVELAAPSTFDNVWKSTYGNLLNIKEMIDKVNNGTANSGGMYDVIGAAEVLWVVNFGILTDMHGDIPYSEALQGAANMNAKADAQKDVYAGLISTIDDAIANLEKGAALKNIQNVEYLLDSVQASTMLSNSEFVVMLNQAYSDRAKLSKLLNISDEQMSYVTNADAGCGLIKYGSALVPFINRFPRDTKLYQLMTTKPGEGVFGGNTSN